MNIGVLHPLRRRLASWLGLQTFLLLAGILGGFAFFVVLADAAFDLSDHSRALVPWVLLVLGLAVMAFGVWRWRRLEDRRLARLFERAQPALGNRLINAVQLSQQPGATPVEQYLRTEAVELGQQAAAGVDVRQAVRRGLKFAGGTAGAAFGAWLILVMIAGPLLRAVAPRFTDPSGDHPPYSRMTIAVNPGKTQVLYGGQVEIRATVGPVGTGAEKLWLVAKSGTNVLRAMMFLAPDKSFFQTLANLREPTEYYITDGRARSHRFPVQIRYTPQISLVEVTTTFPQYTGKATRIAKLSDEPQELPEDTAVRFRVISNRPLKGGNLVLTPVLGGSVVRVPLVPETQANVVTGAFTFKAPVVFSVSVRDVSDLESADPRQGRFNLLPDERPRIFVLQPGRDAVATPTISVPVRVEATDDYAITRVVWLRGHNRSTERPFSMKLELKSGPRAVEAAGAFDFAKLGVRPGDLIEYYFEAADNYPKGPNLTLSRLYRLQIISKEQYDAILRQAAARKALFEPYFQLHSWLQRLAERARNLEKRTQSGSPADREAAVKELTALNEDMGKYEAALGKLLEGASLFDVEEAFKKALTAQQAEFGQTRSKLGAMLGQFDPARMAEIAKELTEMAQAEEEQVERPARQIAAVAQLLGRADTFVKLARQQTVLAQMLRRFNGRTGGFSRSEQIEIQELTYHERRIQEALRSLLASFPELLAKVPDEPQYEDLRNDVNDFIQAVADAKIEEDLAETANKLTGLDGTAGHRLALQAAAKMDALIARCNSMPEKGEACLRFKPSMQQSLGGTLEQILAAMGAKAGSGQGGRDGYGMFNDDVALYGPNVELAGEQAGGRSDTDSTARGGSRVAGSARDIELSEPAAAGRVRLQPDARFPLRYRDLVGEYFRVIGESENNQGDQP